MPQDNDTSTTISYTSRRDKIMDLIRKNQSNQELKSDETLICHAKNTDADGLSVLHTKESSEKKEEDLADLTPNGNVLNTNGSHSLLPLSETLSVANAISIDDEGTMRTSHFDALSLPPMLQNNTAVSVPMELDENDKMKQSESEEFNYVMLNSVDTSSIQTRRDDTFVEGTNSENITFVIENTDENSNDSMSALQAITESIRKKISMQKEGEKNTQDPEQGMEINTTESIVVSDVVELVDCCQMENGSSVNATDENPGRNREKRQRKATENHLQTENGSSGNDIDETPRRKREKRHNVDCRKWRVKRSQECRKKGKAYLGRKCRNGTWNYDVPKSARKMRNRCNCKMSKKPTVLKCFQISDKERKSIFEDFWNMTWESKKTYVKMLTVKTAIQRPRNRKDNSKTRRKYSCQYFLRNRNNNTNIRVCKKMFHNTLGIGEWTALNWQTEEVNNNDDNKSDDESSVNLDNDDDRIESDSEKRLRKARDVEKCKEFLGSLAKIESHYCRANSTKLYLEPCWQSKNELYLFYKEWCSSQNVGFLSNCRFAQLFSDENLSLFRPKKDECDTCTAYKEGNLSQDLFDLHMKRKEEARSEKDKDKQSDDVTLIFTMDVQAVLLCPKSKVSSLYFKTKLAVHNFTVFNLKNKEGSCYLWNETEGGLTANEFATIISEFLVSQIEKLPNARSDSSIRVILFSDGCGYQNRNATLTNALLHVAMIENVTIEQKFLEKGHTQMECDSMHSTIERKLRDKKINVPADYVKICEEARRSPAPYHVKYLTYDFFKSFAKQQFYKSIRPGKGIGDPRVTDLRALQYLPNGRINYKLSFTDEWKELGIRKNTSVQPTKLTEFPTLYKNRLKIKQSKYNDLQALKNTFPADYHSFYDNLQYE